MLGYTQMLNMIFTSHI